MKCNYENTTQTNDVRDSYASIPKADIDENVNDECIHIFWTKSDEWGKKKESLFPVSPFPFQPRLLISMTTTYRVILRTSELETGLTYFLTRAVHILSNNGEKEDLRTRWQQNLS